MNPIIPGCQAIMIDSDPCYAELIGSEVSVIKVLAGTRWIIRSEAIDEIVSKDGEQFFWAAEFCLMRIDHPPPPDESWRDEPIDDTISTGVV